MLVLSFSKVKSSSTNLFFCVKWNEYALDDYEDVVVLGPQIEIEFPSKALVRIAEEESCRVCVQKLDQQKTLFAAW